MSDPEKMKGTTLRHHLMAVLRDALTITAVLSLGGSLAWFFVGPRVEPFLTLPDEVAQINARLGPITDPHLIDFAGPALIAGERVVRPGEGIRLIYLLRRNASCQSEVEVSFLNADTGSRLTTGIMRSVQAPVTEDYNTFILTLVIPENLPEGNWSYFPRIVPLQCGLYQAYNGALSEIFTVER